MIYQLFFELRQIKKSSKFTDQKSFRDETLLGRPYDELLMYSLGRKVNPLMYKSGESLRFLFPTSRPSLLFSAG